jgi:hypothetical protein
LSLDKISRKVYGLPLKPEKPEVGEARKPEKNTFPSDGHKETQIRWDFQGKPVFIG